MPQTIYGGQVGSEVLRAGDLLTVTVDVGSGAIVERFAGGRVVERAATAATANFGPYIDDMVFRLSVFPGATVHTSTSDQPAERASDTDAAAIAALVLQAESTPAEYADIVSLSATGIAKSGPGRLKLLQVMSGSGSAVLADGAGTGTQGLTTILTLSSLAAGDEIPFDGGAADGGLPFVNALLVTITGTMSLKLTVV